MEASFEVYQYRFTIRSSFVAPLEHLRQDFEYFAASPAADSVLIELFDADPPFDQIPDVDASVYTPRNVVYRAGGRRYIDYHGRALALQDESSRHLQLYSRDANLLYEATYLYLLSQIGQYLDRHRLHRIHALGVVIRNKAALVLLPMGGGKSTLAVNLLKHSEVKLLSDDSPFIDSGGHALPYPLRIGVLEGSENTIPAEQRRLIQRMEFGPKYLVNYSYFKDRVAKSVEVGLVVIGVRNPGNACRIEEVSKLAGLRACLANCVIGVGLFQGLEFILNSSGWELLGQSRVGMSRLLSCYQMLRRARVCRVHLGRDSELNAQTILDYASSI
ncbi:MAG TPA: hypothetical protein VKR29_09920 [Candidatus Binataceae bacterium]|nr:hypothetical protein [Candidatus Binataceae bacterium]